MEHASRAPTRGKWFRTVDTVICHGLVQPYPKFNSFRCLIMGNPGTAVCRESLQITSLKCAPRRASRRTLLGLLAGPRGAALAGMGVAQDGAVSKRRQRLRGKPRIGATSATAFSSTPCRRTKGSRTTRRGRMRSTVSHRRWRSLRWSRRSAGTACATLRTVSGDCVVTTRQSLPERFSQALRGAPTPKHRLVRADQPTIPAETLRLSSIYRKKSCARSASATPSRTS